MKRTKLIQTIVSYLIKVKGVVAFHKIKALNGKDITFFMETNGISIIVEKFGNHYPGGVISKDIAFSEISVDALEEIVSTIDSDK